MKCKKNNNKLSNKQTKISKKLNISQVEKHNKNNNDTRKWMKNHTNRQSSFQIENIQSIAKQTQINAIPQHDKTKKELYRKPTHIESSTSRNWKKQKNTHIISMSIGKQIRQTMSISIDMQQQSNASTGNSQGKANKDIKTQWKIIMQPINATTRARQSSKANPKHKTIDTSQSHEMPWWSSHWAKGEPREPKLSLL